MSFLVYIITIAIFKIWALFSAIQVTKSAEVSVCTCEAD